MTELPRDRLVQATAPSRGVGAPPNASWRLISHSAKDTAALGGMLATLLCAGDVLSLDGELGAGKTVLTQGIGEGIGVPKRAIRSPTYTIAHRHDMGRLPLIHIDAYRLSGPEDLLELGLEEVLVRDAVVVVEWAARVKTMLPNVSLSVRLQHTVADARLIIIEGSEARWCQLLDPVAERASGTEASPGSDKSAPPRSQEP